MKRILFIGIPLVILSALAADRILDPVLVSPETGSIVIVPSAKINTAVSHSTVAGFPASLTYPAATEFDRHLQPFKDEKICQSRSSFRLNSPLETLDRSMNRQMQVLSEERAVAAEDMHNWLKSI